MAVDEATQTLIILLVIIGVMVVVLILTIIVLIFRWKRYKAHRGSLMYPYSIPEQFTNLQHPRHSQHQRDSSPYTYASPNAFSVPIAPFGESTDSHEPHRIEEDDSFLYASPRISAISWTSVDMGNLHDVSAFVHDPHVYHIRYQQENTRGKVDSMRSSAGVDLGGDYNKAWKIVGTEQQFHL